MIKISTFLFLCLFLMSGVINAQYNIRDRYEQKLHEYNRMKVKGIVFLSIGAATGAGAAALFYKSYEFNANGPQDGNPAEDYFWGGVSVGCIAIPFFLAGGILTPIGAIKSREYKKLIESLSINPVVTPKMQGITLVYRF